jgi:hypothetical protein
VLNINIWPILDHLLAVPDYQFLNMEKNINLGVPIVEYVGEVGCVNEVGCVQ